MGNDTTKVEFNITDNGSTKKLVRDVSELDAKLQSAGKAAAYMATNAAKATKAQLENATMSSSDRLGYGVARSAVGTGAEGRDFAKQAQGLGGLVRLYATFAANLFAVGAAFTALKNAADTTNMIKGLDQLGAASGKNLGGVSQELVKLTDGAISLREAMTATVQATSAGMSTENLKKLATGAKNASLALGISMPDALSRLSRGITKLEPELLDELGVFVRIDDAVSKYARSIGKPVSALTDLERRTAFSIDVLDQLDKKFGEIKIDSNPYDKLLASLKDIAQQALDLTNKVLGPLMNFLSSNPTALQGALAAAAVMIVKQAIPALGSVKEELNATAETARKVANMRAVEAQRSYKNELKRVELLAESKAEAEIRRVDESAKAVAAIRNKSFKDDAAMQEIMNKQHADITAADIKRIQERAVALEKSGDAKAAKEYREAGNALASWKKAEEDLAGVKKKNIDLLTQEHSALSTIGMTRVIAHRANMEAITREISAQAAQTASTNGFISAMKQVNEEVKKARQGGVVKISMPQFDEHGTAILDQYGKQVTAVEEITQKKMGNIRTAWTYTRGAISAATGALSTFMAFLSPWAAAIGLVVSAAGLLLEHFSTSKEESKRYAEALQGLTSALETADKVIDRLRGKSPLEQMSIEAIQARATAFSTLTESMQSALTKGFEKISKMGTADNMMDWVKSWVDADIRSEMSETFSKAVVDSLKLAQNTPAKKEFESFLKKTLNITVIDAESLEKAYKKLSDSSAKKLIPEIAEAWKAVSKEQAVTAAKGTELVDTFKKSADVMKELQNSFMPSDNLSKLGMSMIETAGKLDLALDDPIQSLNAMQEVVKNTSNLSLFPESTAKQLLDLKTQVDNAAKEYAGATDALEKYGEKLQSLSDKKIDLEDQLSTAKSSKEVEKLEKQLSRLQGRIEYIQGKQSSLKIFTDLILKPEIDNMKGAFKEAVVAQMVAGAEIVSSKISTEWAKGAAIATNAIASILGKSEAAINLRAKAEQEQLAAQKAAIQTQINLITSNEKLATELELTRITEEKKTTDKGSDKYKALETREADLVKKQDYLKEGVTKGTSAKLAKDLANGVSGAKEALSYVQKVESAMAQLNSLSAQSFSVEIQRQAGLIAVQSEKGKQKIDDQRQSVQLQLDELSAIEARGQILSDEEQTQKTALQNKIVGYDYDLKIADINEQIAIKKLAVANLDKVKNAEEISTINTEITRLQTTEKINAGKKKESDITKNTATNIGRQLKDQNALRDSALETAHAYQQMAMSQRQTSVETARIGLEAANSTGKMYETVYIKEKQSLDLLQQRVDLEAKEMSLKQANAKLLNKLNDELIAERDADRKKAKEAEIQAAKEKLTVDLSNEKQVYDAKIDSINKIAEYDLSNTALKNNLAEAVWTGLTEGGEAGSKAVKQALMDELKKPMNIIIKALISPITSGLQAMFETLFQTMAFDIAGVITASFDGIIPALVSLVSGSGEDGLGIISKIGNAFSGLTNLFSGVSKLETAISSGIDKLGLFQSSSPTNPLSAGAINGMDAADNAAKGISNYAGSTAGMLGKVGAYAGYGLAGYGLGSLIGGQYKIGSIGAKTTSGAGTLIGSLAGGPIGGLIGGLIGGTISRIFGAKTSVRDAGIEGTFGDQGFSGRTFKDMKKSGFLRRTRYWTEYGSMDKETQSSLGKAFLNVRSSTADLAETIGGNASAVEHFTKSIRLSFQGLTDAQAKTKLIEELGKMQEEMADLALGTKAYTKEGETQLQTLQRLSASFEAANNVFDMLGQTVLTASISNADLADQFVSAFGGADKMASVSQQYFQDYYTEQERVDAQTRLLTKEFGKLGHELPSGRAELRKWIDEAQAAGDPTTYAKLMNLAGSFTQISDAAGAASKVLLGTFSTAFSDIMTNIIQLSTTAEEFKSVQRENELSALDSQLRAMKKYEYALQDVKDAQNNVTSAQEALSSARKAEADALKQQQNSIQSSINSLKNFINNFTNFKQSLLFDSSASVLTPEQKYAQAKAQFDAVLSAATSTGQTEADKARRMDALGKLESTSRTFLETSRAAYASSAQYTTDFNAVQNALTAATSSAEQQVSLDQQTVDGIQAQIELLTDVKSGIMTVAEATTKLAAANDILASKMTDVALIKATTTKPATAEEIISAANEAYNTMSSESGGKAPNYSELMSAVYSKYQIDPVDFMKTFTTGMFSEMRDPIVSLSASIEEPAAALTSASESLREITFTLRKFMSVPRTRTITTSADDTASARSLMEEYYRTQLASSSLKLSQNELDKAVAIRMARTFDISDSTDVTAHALGGLARGLSLVGEQGPELVDFNTPGRVYTADQTAGMFAGGGTMSAVVAELKALKAEVCELRKQQSTETGHLIAASFEAQQKNSEEIAKAFDETTNKTTWNDRVKQAVILN